MTFDEFPGIIVLCNDFFTANSSDEGSVRLIGGLGPHEGLVQVLLAGYWGTVCDYKWGLLDAIVVCRQLGYLTALAAPTRAAFGQGTGFTWMSGVSCTGYENSITQCPSSGIMSYVYPCSHSRDAGVICSVESESQDMSHA